MKANLDSSHILQSYKRFRNSTPDQLFRQKCSGKKFSSSREMKIQVCPSLDFKIQVLFPRINFLTKAPSASVQHSSFYTKLPILTFSFRLSFPVLTVPCSSNSTDVALDQQLCQSSLKLHKSEKEAKSVLSPVHLFYKETALRTRLHNSEKSSP